MGSSFGRRLRRRFDAFSVSPAGLALPVRVLAGYPGRVDRRTAWRHEGAEALEQQLREDGPVVLAMWHARLLYGTRFWRPGWPPVMGLTSTAFPGQLGGQTMARFGIATQALHDSRPAQSDMRRVAKAIRGGASLVIQADGPVGPARKASSVALDWARITGRPIWLAAGSGTAFRQLESWDRMMVPRRGGEALFAYRPWGVDVPKRVTPDAMRDLQLRLTRDLDEWTGATDRKMGHDRLVA